MRALRLESGPLLPDRVRHDTLSAAESDYFMKYSNALGEYMGAVGFDLSQDLQVRMISIFFSFILFN